MRGSILICMCLCVPLTLAVPRQGIFGFRTRAAQSGGFFGEIENLKNNFFSFIKKGFGGRPPQNIPPPLQPPPNLAIRPGQGGKIPPPRPAQPPKNPLPLPPNFPNSFASFNPNPPTSSFGHQHQQGGGFLNAAPPSEASFGFQGPPIGSFPKPEFSFGEIPAPALGPTPAPAPLPVPVHSSKPHFTEENYHIPAVVQQFGAPAFFDSSKKPQETANVQPFVDLTGELELGDGGGHGIHDHKHTISDSNKQVILNNLIDQDLLDRVKHNLWREDLKNTQLAHNKKTHLNKSTNRRLLIDRPTLVVVEDSPAVTLESKTLPVVESVKITPAAEQTSQQQTTSEVNFGFMDPSLFEGF